MRVHSCLKRSGFGLSNEKGSVIVIALIVLVILTLGGISAIQRSVTESFIVRNSAIYKQNLQLAESAAAMGMREIIQIDPDDLEDNNLPEPWMMSKGDWETAPLANFGDFDDTNSKSYVETYKEETGAEELPGTHPLKQRGEEGGGTLRYYFVGWELAPGEDQVQAALGEEPVQWLGRVIGAYESEHFGRKWIELGVGKKFINNG